MEANYLIVLAYQYTSITSVTLLDCTSIPIVMALSACLFRRRYKRCVSARGARVTGRGGGGGRVSTCRGCKAPGRSVSDNAH